MEPLAIVGMACRFPGAPSLPEFWTLLAEGLNGAGPVPAERWDAEALYSVDPKAPGKTSSRLGGFIDDVDRFDAAAFGISPREATQMDPQQRILLELAHEAFEDAGVAPDALAGSDTAVFIGAMSNDYLRHQTADDYRLIDVHTGGGAGFSMLANRLSYHFDLHGPSMAIDSACSSSLVTVFQACQALWTGQSALALAGGVNLMLDPAFNVFYAKGGLLAPDGRCKTFSARADGIGRGEGAGLVVLKRERDALQDGDAIYAVIRGGAVNHGGRSNGVTAPNRWSQERLLRTAFEHAQVGADQLQYVELHGTGTYIGDPIEANALGTVMKEHGRVERCAVGSVKSNLGHLEGAAGVAGLIKLALCLHHRTLVPSLGFDEPSPAIDFENLPLAVQTTRGAWPRPGLEQGPLLAGISSFGLGGTNAHLVLASSSAPASRPAGTAPGLLLLSAQGETALRAVAQQIRALLADEQADVAAVCMTTLRRRGLHDHRLVVLGHDRATLLAALDDHLAGRANAQVLAARFRPRRQALVVRVPHCVNLDLPALARWLGQSPAGREAWDSCRELLMTEFDLRLPPLRNLAEAHAPGDDAISAVWCFAAQYAVLTQLLAVLPPAATLEAFGSGQLAACCAAGALGLSDALDWLRRGLAGPAPATGAYRVPCVCAGLVDPALASLDWHSRAAPPASLATGKTAPTLIALNLDGRVPAAPAAYCFHDDAHEFGRLFAQLGASEAIRWHALADHRFVRLPAYPWQRERYWLARPGTAARTAGDSLATPAVAVAVAAPDTGAALREEIARAPAQARQGVLRGYLHGRIAESLHLPVEALDPAQPLNTIGIDSLTAVEIKNRVERELQVTLPLVKFLDGFAVDDFAALIAAEWQTRAPAAAAPEAPALRMPARLAPAAPAPALPDAIDERIAAMSADQVDDLLQQLMQEAH